MKILLTNRLTFLILIFTLNTLCIFGKVNSQTVNDEKMGSQNVIILLDASASMQKTDPRDHRKLATKAILHLLPLSSKVSIIQFDSDAKILSEWLRINDKKNELIKIVDEVDNKGKFTDFRAGLEAANKMVDRLPAGENVSVLLLSDGIFEPDPYSDQYAPLNTEFVINVIGKSSKEMFKKYKEEYRDRLTTIAKRLIEVEILPNFIKKGVEVFTVGFSPDADREFLSYLANRTSKNKTEVHYFHANEAIDLVNTFMGLLQYWHGMIIVHSETGIVTPNYEKELFIDGFLKEIKFICLFEQNSIFEIKTSSGIKETNVLTSLPNLNILQISQATPPGIWKYGFNAGEGRYSLLVVGQSEIDMIVQGLQEKYLFGETIEAQVSVRSNGENAIELLDPNSVVKVKMEMENVVDQSIDLRSTDGRFPFRFSPDRTGKINLKFILYAKDQLGRDMLPRPSREYQCEVLPRFFVEPDFIDFGDIDKGEVGTFTIRAHSGLSSQQSIRVFSKVINASRCETDSAKFPNITSFAFTIKPGEVQEHSLSLVIPEDGCWGDFEGEIFFSGTDTDYKIKYSAHVPSLFEKLTIPILIILVIIFLILSGLIILWGSLKSPVGVLIPIKVPSGVVLDDIELSKVKKGFWKKWLNREKNIVRIDRNKGEIKLEYLPDNLEICLIFHRFGRDYIKNVSEVNSEQTIIIKIPEDNLEIVRAPGESYYLSHGFNIQLGEYEFNYQNV